LDDKNSKTKTVKLETNCNIISTIFQGGKDQAFDPERIEILKELSEKPDAYERLARAIAPSIYENEDVKKGKFKTV
jgi:DNA replicative helicase MCM subunit Mcm2 (Cdc46/Mcm family)